MLSSLLASLLTPDLPTCIVSDSPMRASHSVLLATDHHSGCLVTFSIMLTPHLAAKHLMGHTVQVELGAYWLNFNACMQSILLHFGESFKTWLRQPQQKQCLVD